MLKKTTVKIELEHDTMLGLKKALFANGLTMHQFIGFLFDHIGFNDERIKSLLEDAKTYKKNKIREGSEQQVDAETLYSIIEEELRAAKD